MEQPRWYKVTDEQEELDPAFSKVAVLNGDVYFAVECFNLDKAEAISVIVALDGEGFVYPPDEGQLSGVYISSKTMKKAFKEKKFNQKDIDGFNKVVTNIKEQCGMAQIMKDMKPSVIN